MGLTGFQRRRRRAAKRRGGKEAREEQESKEIKITELTVDEATVLIKETDDIDKIMKWLADESQGKNRTTLIEPLEAKIEELEGEE